MEIISEIRVSHTSAEQYACNEIDKKLGIITRGRSGLTSQEAFDLAFQWAGWNVKAVERYT